MYRNPNSAASESSFTFMQTGNVAFLLASGGQSMLSEFDLIRRYFTARTTHTVLAGGDDAALIRVAPGMELAISVDTLVAGRHFFADAEPEALGHKCMAVNLS